MKKETLFAGVVSLVSALFILLFCFFFACLNRLMYYSFTGKIIDVSNDSIAIDVNGIAFELFVARPLEWQVGTETTVYSYEVYNENDHYLVGFSTKMEKDAFKSLIQVKGIGPKTAINALSATTPDELFRAISASNTSYLKKLPGIGPKAASQIILDLKGKLASPTNKNTNDERYEDVRAALKSMGFKVKDIDAALSSINEPNLSTEDILRAALLKLRGSRK